MILRFFYIATILLALTVAVRPVNADSSAPRHHAIESAGDNLLFTTTLQSQTVYTPWKEGGYSLEQVFYLLFPFRGVLVPGLKSDELFSVLRLQPQWIHESAPVNPSWGLEDFALYDLVGHNTSFGAVGFGLASSIPTATHSAFGSGKWSLGPAFGATIRSISKLRIGILLEQFFSIAGDSSRPRVSSLLFEPTLILYLPSQLYLKADPTFTFDWVSGQSSKPINLAVGSGLTQHFSAEIRPEYQINHPDSNHWRFVLNLFYID